MKKADKIIICAICLLSAVSIVFQNAVFEGYAKKTIIIESQGKTYASYDAKKLTETKTITIKTELGENKLEISKNGAKMLDSDCRDKACLSAITRIGGVLVCAPHKLIIRIEGAKGDNILAY